MAQDNLLNELIAGFCCLPGVGQKTAQRMAYYLLERDREGGRHLAHLLDESMEKIGHCQQCRTLTEAAVCRICSNTSRDASQLCIVETPAEVAILEQSIDYSGHYFVLGGRLSPLDGIGPKEIGLDQLDKRLAEGEIKEMILATNPTVEGEVTAQYIGEMAKVYAIKATRIAHGVPLGGELEYVDGGTLLHAFAGRAEFMQER
jgi:recombination protein RecR